MNVEQTTYRICPDCNGTGQVGEFGTDRFPDQCICTTGFVPDGRFQAIADAPRCEHGMIDEHRHVVGWNPDYNDNFGTVTCQGAPVLRALLDALGRTDE